MKWVLLALMLLASTATAKEWDGSMLGDGDQLSKWELFERGMRAGSLYTLKHGKMPSAAYRVCVFNNENATEEQLEQCAEQACLDEGFSARDCHSSTAPILQPLPPLPVLQPQ